MTAITPIEPAPTAGHHGEGHTIFSPRRQGDFLASLAHSGNVRLACRAASVSSQTAYRARRCSPGFARAWDAALLAARDHAEQVLADRALDGWEEAVFYHGEEVARRRRYSDRLLLAHLARLDRLEERGDVAEALTRLDDVIDGLREGEAIEDCFPAQAGTSVGCAGRPETPACAGDHGKGAGDRESSQDTVPPVPSCRVCAGAWAGEEEGWVSDGEGDGESDSEDSARLLAMNLARPAGVPWPSDLGATRAAAQRIERYQLEAFEVDGHRWWEVTCEETMMDSILYGHVEEDEEDEDNAVDGRDAGMGEGGDPASAAGDGGGDRPGTGGTGRDVVNASG